MDNDENHSSEQIRRLALEIFEDPVKADHWFQARSSALESNTPLELLDSHQGRQRVKTVLIRIADGTFG